MIKGGINDGVMQLDDFIKYLQSVRETEGNLKLCVNGSFVYDLEDTVEVELMSDIIDIVYNI